MLVSESMFFSSLSLSLSLRVSWACQAGHCSYGPRGPPGDTGVCVWGGGPGCPGLPTSRLGSVRPPPSLLPAPSLPAACFTAGFDESNSLSGWDLPQPAGQGEGCRSRRHRQQWPWLVRGEGQEGGQPRGLGNLGSQVCLGVLAGSPGMVFCPERTLST